MISTYTNSPATTELNETLQFCTPSSVGSNQTKNFPFSNGPNVYSRSACIDE